VADIAKADIAKLETVDMDGVRFKIQVFDIYPDFEAGLKPKFWKLHQQLQAESSGRYFHQG